MAEEFGWYREKIMMMEKCGNNLLSNAEMDKFLEKVESRPDVTQKL